MTGPLDDLGVPMPVIAIPARRPVNDPLVIEADAARALPAGDAIEDAVDRLNDVANFGNAVRRDAAGRRRNRRYSRDLRAAMHALTSWFSPYLFDSYTFTRFGQEGRPVEPGYRPAFWRVEIIGFDHGAVPPTGTPAKPSWLAEGEGDTLPLAICRAMLHLTADDDADDDAPWGYPIYGGGTAAGRDRVSAVLESVPDIQRDQEDE
jgi:hypothetical protein